HSTDSAAEPIPTPALRNKPRQVRLHHLPGTAELILSAVDESRANGSHQEPTEWQLLSDEQAHALAKDLQRWRRRSAVRSQQQPTRQTVSVVLVRRPLPATEQVGLSCRCVSPYIPVRCDQRSCLAQPGLVVL